MLGLKRIDAEEEEETEIKVDDEPMELGRGPLLRIDATNISRKHVSVRREDGMVLLKCIHRNPVVRVKLDGSVEEVQQGDETQLFHGDVIRFLPDRFHFQLNLPETRAMKARCQTGKDPSPKKSRSPEDQRVSTKEKKPRKLPDWMVQNQTMAPNKENSPPNQSAAKTPKKKSPRKAVSSPTTPTGKGASRKASSISGADQTKLEDNANNDVEEMETSDNIPEEPMEVTVPDVAAGVDKVTLETDPNSKDTDVNKILTKSDTAVKLNKIDDDDTPKGAAAQDKASAPRASTSRVEFPVLIKPEDLQDSDEEAPPEPKKKPAKKKARRPVCPYGANCYRKNPHHFDKESHPGDEDYAEEDEDNQDESDDRPECEYGVNCYRKNPYHRQQFKHTHKPQPKRRAKVRTKKDEDDEYESDFIDDEDIEDELDDTDEDEDWKYPEDDE